MRRSLPFVPLVLALIIPGHAGAHGVVTRTGGVLSYSAIGDQRGSELRITSPRRGIVRLSDRGTPGGIVWGPCFPASQYAADCGAKNLTRIEITLGSAADSVSARVSVPLTIDAAGGDDRITGGYERNVIDAGPGDDVLIGGTGGNSISAGSGNDSIEIRNGARDQYSCGGGIDTVTADPLDPPPSPLDCPLASFDAAPAPADTRAPKARVAKGAIKLRRRLSIDATLDEPGRLKLAGKLLIGPGPAGKLGKASAKPDAPGQFWTMHPRLTARLAAKAKRALGKGKRVRAALKLTARDGAGNTRRTREFVPLRD